MSPGNNRIRIRQIQSRALADTIGSLDVVHNRDSVHRELDNITVGLSTIIQSMIADALPIMLILDRIGQRHPLAVNLHLPPRLRIDKVGAMGLDVRRGERGSIRLTNRRRDNIAN